MKILRFGLLLVGLLILLLSVPMLGFAALGFAGILADVSVQENREFGLQFLTYGGPMFLAGLVIVGLSFFCKASGASANTSTVESDR